jgi:glycolate oxidase iron-sulfur subunit
LLRRIKAMLALAPDACRRRDLRRQRFSGVGERRGRVALLQGCAQQVLAPRINQAAINLLTRHGIEVVLVKDEQCCGALTHHLGRTATRWRAPAPISRCGKGKRNKAASTPSW